MNNIKQITKILNEDKRSQLVQSGKQGAYYKTDRSKGRNRFERRVKSKVANNTKSFNQIDMNKLFRDGILTVNVNVRGETDDYQVKISFGRFLDIVQRYAKKFGKVDLRTITLAVLDGFNQDDVYIHCSCLHPSTKIKLLDGRTVTVEQMKQLFDSGEKLYVYSTDKNGDFNPGEVEKVWITKETEEFIKVVLDNNQEILTTPDHLYMMRDGSYKEAQDLKANDSLYNHKIKSVEKVVLEKTPVYDIKVKDWHNFVVNAGVVLHNCDDWRYRMAYFCTRKQLNSGEPENRPSDITNPNDDLGHGCKHVMLVIANNNWLKTVARVIYNYILYMKEHREDLYARIIYPAIYGKKYEDEYQLPLEDEDNLADDSDTISRASQAGIERGRFQKGNQSGVQFARKQDSENDDQISFEDA